MIQAINNWINTFPLLFGLITFIIGVGVGNLTNIEVNRWVLRNGKSSKKTTK